MRVVLFYFAENVKGKKYPCAYFCKYYWFSRKNILVI